MPSNYIYMLQKYYFTSIYVYCPILFLYSFCSSFFYTSERVCLDPLTSIKDLAFLFDKISLAKLVKGPLVSNVILDPESNVFRIDSQISGASDCLRSGLSVSLGAPYFTEFSAVYLRTEFKNSNILKTHIPIELSLPKEEHLPTLPKSKVYSDSSERY